MNQNDIGILYGKDALIEIGRLIDIGTPITNNYSYENNRIKTITHNGFNYSFDYDFFGNNKVVSVAGKNLIQNIYEVTTGNLIESDYGNGQSISTDYDNLDRVISRKFKDILYL